MGRWWREAADEDAARVALRWPDLVRWRRASWLLRWLGLLGLLLVATTAHAKGAVPQCRPLRAACTGHRQCCTHLCCLWEPGKGRTCAPNP